MLHVSVKNNHNKSLIKEPDDREKQCICLMDEGRYTEFWELLTGLNQDITWKCAQQLPFQYILEQALERKDKRAVQTVLPFMKMIRPVSFWREQLITEEPELFRELLNSQKFDCSPSNVMTVKTGKQKFEGNLLEIMVGHGMTELVRIFLEEYKGKGVKKTRDRLFEGDRLTLDDLMGSYRQWQLSVRYTEHNLFLLIMALVQGSKEITTLVMEYKRYQGPDDKVILPYQCGTKKQKKEFLIWFLEHYMDHFMIGVDLKWILCNSGEYNYREGILRGYEKKKGLKKVLEEIEACVTDNIQYVDWNELSDCLVEAAMICLKTLKRMEKNKCEKEKICKTEAACYEKIRAFDKTYYRPWLFLMTVDYWYRKEKNMDSKTMERLLQIYICSGETEDTDSKLKCSFITNRERKTVWNRGMKQIEACMEKPVVKECVLSIRTLQERKIQKKKMAVVMEKLNPQKNRTMERDEAESSFLAVILFLNSPMMVKKAWKLDYLTNENIPKAVAFASEHDLRKILPYLFQMKEKNTNQEENPEYIL